MPEVTEPQPKKATLKKTCACRLEGNGVDIKIGEITLEANADLKRFAKKAYQVAASSLRKLELPGYRIAVMDNGVESVFALDELRTRAA